MRCLVLALVLVTPALAVAQPAPKIAPPKLQFDASRIKVLVPRAQATAPKLAVPSVESKAIAALPAATRVSLRASVAKSLGLEGGAFAEPQTAMSLTSAGTTITLGSTTPRAGEAYASFNRPAGVTYHRAVWQGPGPEDWGSMAFVIPLPGAMTAQAVFDLDCPMSWTMPSFTQVDMFEQVLPTEGSDALWIQQTAPVVSTDPGGYAGHVYAAFVVPPGNWRTLILSIGIHDLPHGHTISIADCQISRLR